MDAGTSAEPAECYYALLGVDRASTPQDIERAWRQRAREVHPDKAPEDRKEAAEAAFKALSSAHEVLADPEQRRRYDLYGPTLRPQRCHDFGLDPAWGGGDGAEEFMDADFMEAMLRAMMAQSRQRRAPPPEPADVWEGMLGLGLVGLAIAASSVLSWAFSPSLGRVARWVGWQWRFLLYDLKKALRL